MLEDRVLQFVADQTGYRVWTESGTRLDVVRCNSIQPDIVDPEDYCTYMWIKALQGFFLLRQRICAREPQDWFLVQEVLPAINDPAFFFDYWDRLGETLSSVPPGISPPESRCPRSTGADSPE
ncbi:MAG: hypothetical protein HY319_03340 [Armatimonadetes bacterium]|nr:hypothetical protein [Armatimonadota bacterium]